MASTLFIPHCSFISDHVSKISTNEARRHICEVIFPLDEEWVCLLWPSSDGVYYGLLLSVRQLPAHAITQNAFGIILSLVTG